MKKMWAGVALSLSLTSYSFAGTDDSLNVASEADSMSQELVTYLQHTDSVISSLDFKSGEISIGNSLAMVKVPKGFKFLTARDAQTVLADLWGNPKDESTLGMLVPDSTNFLSAESWAISFSYEEDGHVEDDDAEEIDYTDLLKQMKEDILASNAERTKQGFQKIELIGWAQQPYYDKGAHKLHWAKEIKFGTDSVNTLNYNIRMLGRKGVLVLNVIAGIDNMPVVKSNINTIISSTNFASGNRYEDFDSSIDNVAEYGIGGLIAGGILAKTGVLAKLGIFFIKIWKLLAIGVVGLLAFLKKKFSGGGGN